MPGPESRDMTCHHRLWPANRRLNFWHARPKPNDHCCTRRPPSAWLGNACPNLGPILDSRPLPRKFCTNTFDMQRAGEFSFFVKCSCCLRANHDIQNNTRLKYGQVMSPAKNDINQIQPISICIFYQHRLVAQPAQKIKRFRSPYIASETLAPVSHTKSKQTDTQNIFNSPRHGLLSLQLRRSKLQFAVAMCCQSVFEPHGPTHASN